MLKAWNVIWGYRGCSNPAGILGVGGWRRGGAAGWTPAVSASVWGWSLAASSCHAAHRGQAVLKRRPELLNSGSRDWGLGFGIWGTRRLHDLQTYQAAPVPPGRTHSQAFRSAGPGPCSCFMRSTLPRITSATQNKPVEAGQHSHSRDQPRPPLSGPASTPTLMTQRAGATCRLLGRVRNQHPGGQLAPPAPHMAPRGGLLGAGPLLPGGVVALVAVPHPVPGQDDRHQHHRAVRYTPLHDCPATSPL